MKCPYCTSNDTRVINSRPSDEGGSIRRRRECAFCGRRFTTYERAQFEALLVLKRSGRKEPFDPDKLLEKLRIACNKRPVTEKELREFSYGFEDEVQVPEISSEEIGRRTLAFLRGLDDVAYIRFLSVYRDFDSVDRFLEEIRHLSPAAERAAGAKTVDGPPAARIDEPPASQLDEPPASQLDEPSASRPDGSPVAGLDDSPPGPLDEGPAAEVPSAAAAPDDADGPAQPGTSARATRVDSRGEERGEEDRAGDPREGEPPPSADADAEAPVRSWQHQRGAGRKVVQAPLLPSEPAETERG